MKNVMNIFHDSCTFVVPIGTMRNDVTEFSVTLLNNFSIKQGILIMMGGFEIYLAIG